MDISQKNWHIFSDNANLFSRSAALNAGIWLQLQCWILLEAISTGLKLSGANAQESSSVILSLAALVQGIAERRRIQCRQRERRQGYTGACSRDAGVAKDLKSMAIRAVNH